MTPTIFTLEGNIGAGKSTLLAALENQKFSQDHVVVFEPVNEWMNAKPSGADGPSIFEMYYADKKKYGFMFQMFALQTRMAHMAEIIENNPNKIIICERCHLTDREIFAKMLAEQGIISEQELYVYNRWYETMMRTIKPKIGGIIYLQVAPEVCVNRIMKRNRGGEENIDIAYIRRLHASHEQWLTQNNNQNFPVHIVDGNAATTNIDLAQITAFIDHSIATA